MKPVIVKQEYSNGEIKYVIRVQRSFLFIKWWSDLVEYNKLEHAQRALPGYERIFEPKKLIKEEKVE